MMIESFIIWSGCARGMAPNIWLSHGAPMVPNRDWGVGCCWRGPKVNPMIRGGGGGGAGISTPWFRAFHAVAVPRDRLMGARAMYKSEKLTLHSLIVFTKIVYWPLKPIETRWALHARED